MEMNSNLEWLRRKTEQESQCESVAVGVRWVPKDGSTTLDGIKPGDHSLFRYILTRNGHNVALYGGLDKCQSDLVDRMVRFPADDWAFIDREAK